MARPQSRQRSGLPSALITLADRAEPRCPGPHLVGYVDDSPDGSDRSIVVDVSVARVLRRQSRVLGHNWGSGCV